MNKNRKSEWVEKAQAIGDGGIPRRLKRGVGSEAPTGSAAAKRAEEPGGAKDRERSDRPQSSAVPPGKAKAALNLAIKVVNEEADDLYYAFRRLETTGQLKEAAKAKQRAAARRLCARVLKSMLPKPDSEQRDNACDNDQSQKTVEGCATPSVGTASGRRNA